MKLYTYREFSQCTHTTIRTLRHYEAMGLCKPILHNKIKHLSQNDFVRLQTIDLLKAANYTLHEIKDILEENTIQEQIVLQKELLELQALKTQSMLELISYIQEHPDKDISQLYEQLHSIENEKYLDYQFKEAKRLQYRIQFHHKHTAYAENFHQWMFSQYQFQTGDRILEIACGDGTLWMENMEKVPKDIHITLIDTSSRMRTIAKKRLQDHPAFESFAYADKHRLPYPDASFDILIANHILMYFDHVDLILQELARVLKPNGTLYCSTMGEHMMKERDALLQKFDPQISFRQDILFQRFSLQNGIKKLSPYFHDITCNERKEQYNIQDVEEYYNFILSGIGMSNALTQLYGRKKEFHSFLEKEFIKKRSFP